MTSAQTLSGTIAGSVLPLRQAEELIATLPGVLSVRIVPNETGAVTRDALIFIPGRQRSVSEPNRRLRGARPAAHRACQTLAYTTGGAPPESPPVMCHSYGPTRAGDYALLRGIRSTTPSECHRLPLGS